jgi:thiosulfate reductase cytochrome b subunit
MAELESVGAPLAASAPVSASSAPATTIPSRHALLVRVTHWITTLCFLALLVTGTEIVISHPRFYWGETGNVLTTPLFKLHIPSSRSMVPSGYGYVLPDQNGWSRYLHFQSAWIVVLTGLLYMLYAFFTGHLRKNLFPAKSDRSLRAFWNAIASVARLPQKPGRIICFSASPTSSLSSCCSR